MNISTSNFLLHGIFTISVVLGSLGCSTVPDSNPHTFDPRQVESLKFSLQNTTAVGVNLPVSEIDTQVIDNLNDWGYIFASPDRPYTHYLHAKIGRIKRGNAPVGFSYAIGNSNPRSPDFQTLDILPIGCSLAPKENPTDQAALTLEVMAEDYIDYSKDSDKSKLSSELTNDISTACFNLLSRLRVKTAELPADEAGSSKRSSWIPEIRIEVEEIPDTPEVTEQAAPVTSGDIADQPDSQTTISPAEKTDTSSPIKIETKKSPKKTGWGNKRIIIHNQGNPVIFQFGHERK